MLIQIVLIGAADVLRLRQNLPCFQRGQRVRLPQHISIIQDNLNISQQFVKFDILIFCQVVCNGGGLPILI